MFYLIIFLIVPHLQGYHNSFSKYVLNFSGGLCDPLSTYVFSIIKAMGTICVDHSEIGKINAVLAAIENLIPLLGAQGYTVLWKV